MTIAMHRLLPPQSTALERAIVDSAPNWDALTDSLGAVEAVRPDSFKPWLAAEWQVAQFAQYFASTDALLTAALPWLFERGTPAAVRRVLGWLGYDQAVLEEDGAFLHIDLGTPVSAIQLAAIRQVVNASLPAHALFYRLYSNLDLRPIVLDDGPELDLGMLDDDSGVLLEGLKLSFEIDSRLALPDEAPLAQASCTTLISALQTPDDDSGWVLDNYALDEPIAADSDGLITIVTASACPASLLDDDQPSWRAALGQTNALPDMAYADLSGIDTLATAAATWKDTAYRLWHGPWTGPWREDGGSNKSTSTAP